MRNLLPLGLILIFAGFVVLAYAASSQGTVSTGGVVFIGPFPIVFGSGPGGGQLALISLAIGVAMVLVILVWGWRFFEIRRSKDEDFQS